MASIMYTGLFVLLLLTGWPIHFAEAKKTGLEGEAVVQPSSETKSTRVFIVYLGGASTTSTKAHTDVHMDMLSRVLGSTQAAQDSILYSYTKSFNGFAAKFSESDAQSFREMDEGAVVFPSKMKGMHTTASWEYLGLSIAKGLWPQSDFGNDIIIGMIDTGIWPESESFRDDGLGPIPSKWKGTCAAGDQFGPENCNMKLIGARFYSKGYIVEVGSIPEYEYNSPRDAVGHGTHTTSTAAGRQDPGVSFFGLANGTASGGASAGRIAVYKACWKTGATGTICTEADILAAFEDAISDGVDLISASIGGTEKTYLTSVAIGSFHAVDRGIVVSASAGNLDLFDLFAVNLAPWILTVGANTLDRTFIATVELGNGMSYQGQAINTYEMNSSYPLVYGGDIPALPSNATSMYCLNGTLDGGKVVGKIIVCYYGPGDVPYAVVQDLGGIGLILIANESMYQSQDQGPSSFIYPLPLTIVNLDQGKAILEYINSTSSPKALIEKSITVFNSTAPPVMADFSLTGPNLLTPNILKPDITAPGVDIIAAVPPNVNPTEMVGDTRLVNFTIMSGTSMSCPHVTGAAALVKSVHPDWSPASIKSALMTTATPLDATIEANTGLATGSGQINPTKAVDPGLVYNASTTDYLLFLCASPGYDSTALLTVFTEGKIVICPTNASTVLDLNYPSIFLSLNSSSNSSERQTAQRTLTNVCQPAEYNVTVVAPTGVSVTVVPSSLSFAAFNDKKSFTVHIEVQDPFQFLDYVFGSIVWSDGTHSVRIPIGVGPSLQSLVDS